MSSLIMTRIIPLIIPVLLYLYFVTGFALFRSITVPFFDLVKGYSSCLMLSRWVCPFLFCNSSMATVQTSPVRVKKKGKTKVSVLYLDYIHKCHPELWDFRKNVPFTAQNASSVRIFIELIKYSANNRIYFVHYLAFVRKIVIISWNRYFFTNEVNYV